MDIHQPGPYVDPELACILQRAFGRVPAVDLIPVPSGASARQRAFALHDPALPPAVMLLRYEREDVEAALHTFHVLQALHEMTFHAAPQVYYMSWEHYSDELLLLLEYISGRSAEGHPVAFFARVGQDFAATLARLHNLSWTEPLELPSVSFHDVLRALRSRVQLFNVPPLRELFRRLEKWGLEIEEQPYSVIHGSYTLESVVSLHARVVGIYDWEQTALADTRLDFGYTCAHLSAYHHQMAETFMGAYTQEAGPVQDARFWNALGGLRVLVELTEALSTLSAPQDAPLRRELGAQWQSVLSFANEQAGIALP